jgi:hypothetical protein
MLLRINVRKGLVEVLEEGNVPCQVVRPQPTSA